MFLDRGTSKRSKTNMVAKLSRLLVWMNVGADVTNGLFSVMGARLGCYKTMCTDWDLHKQETSNQTNYGKMSLKDMMNHCVDRIYLILVML